MKRREFIKTTAIGTVGAGILPGFLNSEKLYAQEGIPEVVWIENGEPNQLLQSAMHELGDLKRFISKGETVVIKPNIGWDRAPELAANTNPQLIEALVKECYAAGAGKVKIFDRTCNNPQRCYRNSQIEGLAKAAGAEVVHVRKNRYKTIPINGIHIKEWPIYKDYLDADKVINVPIAKHHSLGKVTLGLKNLMGVMGGNRGSLHNKFPQKVAEIDKHILPNLTIIDAYRILTANGPSGGNPDHVLLKKTLIASSCTVSADYTALELFGHKLEDAELIHTAAKMGLNKFDLNKLNVKRVVLS